jgi:two-component system response regulator
VSSVKRILLVEDSPQDAELTLRALADGHLADDVLHLRDGAEALDYVYRRGRFADRSDGQPALVLLDLKMPRVGGLEVLQQVKSDRTLKTIPIVVMTSSREDADVMRSYELGVNAYVVKPVRFREFINVVKQIGAFWAVVNEPPPGSPGGITRPGVW